jgi:hypothetical protein
MWKKIDSYKIIAEIMPGNFISKDPHDRHACFEITFINKERVVLFVLRRRRNLSVAKKYKSKFCSGGAARISSFMINIHGNTDYAPTGYPLG